VTNSVPAAESKVLVLCLGNDIRGDDGVGWAVADALGDCPQPLVPVIRRSALSGFYLLDELVGYDRVIVVDAVKTGAHPPGTVLSFPIETLGTEAGPSPHAVGLPFVVELGRQSGVPLPTDIHIVAIEVDDMASIAEGLTASVRAAVPHAVAQVRALLAQATR
jgi:hydrogenase maturation protease